MANSHKYEGSELLVAAFAEPSQNADFAQTVTQKQSEVVMEYLKSPTTCIAPAGGGGRRGPSAPSAAAQRRRRCRKPRSSPGAHRADRVRATEMRV